MLTAGALLQYSNMCSIHNRMTFLLSRAIDPQIEKENDCFDELSMCLQARDLKFFVDSISDLDSSSYKRLETLLLDSFIRLIIGHTADLLVSLIRYHETIERKYFATVNHNYFLAKKISRYGHKKLVELEAIATFLDDSQSLATDKLIRVAEKISALYGFSNNFNNFEIESIHIFQETLHSFLTYKNRIQKVCPWDIFIIKNWLGNQIKDTKKRFLFAGALSYGVLMSAVRYFFGHITVMKNNFSIAQNSLAPTPARVALTQGSTLSKSVTSFVSESFNVNYLAHKEAEYRKSYYPFNKFADFFYVCDVAFKICVDYFAQFKDLLQTGSKTVQGLENSALNRLREVIFFSSIIGQYLQGIGTLSSFLIFFYCAYQFEKILKIRAFDDFKIAFELFEKELYNEFATDLYKSENIVYLQLLLMCEGKKILSPKRLCILQHDIMCIRSFKLWDLVETYLNKMRLNYQISL